ncbi:hypothetical protein JCM3766R1_005998 [Sporobolomyces carnicolor]
MPRRRRPQHPRLNSAVVRDTRVSRQPTLTPFEPEDFKDAKLETLGDHHVGHLLKHGHPAESSNETHANFYDAALMQILKNKVEELLDEITDDDDDDFFNGLLVLEMVVRNYTNDLPPNFHRGLPSCMKLLRHVLSELKGTAEQRRNIQEEAFPDSALWEPLFEVFYLNSRSAIRYEASTIDVQVDHLAEAAGATDYEETRTKARKFVDDHLQSLAKRETFELRRTICRVLCDFRMMLEEEVESVPPNVVARIDAHQPHEFIDLAPTRSIVRHLYRTLERVFAKFERSRSVTKSQSGVVDDTPKSQLPELRPFTRKDFNDADLKALSGVDVGQLLDSRGQQSEGRPAPLTRAHANFRDVAFHALLKKAKRICAQASRNADKAKATYEKVRTSLGLEEMEPEEAVLEIWRRRQADRAVTDLERELETTARIFHEERNVINSVGATVTVLRALLPPNPRGGGCRARLRDPLPAGLTWDELEDCYRSFETALSLLEGPYEERQGLDHFPDGPLWQPFRTSIYPFTIQAIEYEARCIDTVLKDNLAGWNTEHRPGYRFEQLSIEHFLSATFPTVEDDSAERQFRLNWDVCRALYPARIVVEEVGNSIETKIAAVEHARRVVSGVFAHYGKPRCFVNRHSRVHVPVARRRAIHSTGPTIE